MEKRSDLPGDPMTALAPAVLKDANYVRCADTTSTVPSFLIVNEEANSELHVTESKIATSTHR